MSLLRSILRPATSRPHSALRLRTSIPGSIVEHYGRPSLKPQRTYASKAKSTATLVPGSLQPLASESSRQEYTKAEEKMQAAIEWFRRECAAAEARSSGRVTPSLLDPVRVVLPGAPNEPVRLDELATVGVRDGSALLITVFEEHVCIFQPSFLAPDS